MSNTDTPEVKTAEVSTAPVLEFLGKAWEATEPDPLESSAERFLNAAISCVLDVDPIVAIPPEEDGSPVINVKEAMRRIESLPNPIKVKTIQIAGKMRAFIPVSWREAHIAPSEEVFVKTRWLLDILERSAHELRLDGVAREMAAWYEAALRSFLKNGKEGKVDKEEVMSIKLPFMAVGPVMNVWEAAAEIKQTFPTSFLVNESSPDKWFPMPDPAPMSAIRQRMREIDDLKRDLEGKVRTTHSALGFFLGHQKEAVQAALARFMHSMDFIPWQFTPSLLREWVLDGWIEYQLSTAGIFPLCAKEEARRLLKAEAWPKIEDFTESPRVMGFTAKAQEKARQKEAEFCAEAVKAVDAMDLNSRADLLSDWADLRELLRVTSSLLSPLPWDIMNEKNPEKARLLMRALIEFDFSRLGVDRFRLLMCRPYVTEIVDALLKGENNGK